MDRPRLRIYFIPADPSEKDRSFLVMRNVHLSASFDYRGPLKQAFILGFILPADPRATPNSSIMFMFGGMFGVVWLVFRFGTDFGWVNSCGVRDANIIKWTSLCTPLDDDLDSRLETNSSTPHSAVSIGRFLFEVRRFRRHI